ncbi:MAG: hypothetical protein ACOCQY_00425 [Halorhabdus sp.]
MSLHGQAITDSSADRALEAIYDLNRSERACYELVLEADGPMTARAIADAMDCALTSAYRYIDVLTDEELLREVTANFQGTNRSAYAPTPPGLLARQMHREIDHIYAACRDAIEDCRKQFEDAPAGVVIESRADDSLDDDSSAELI